MAIWPGFFKTLCVRLIAGRDFSEVDDAHHARLAIVSRSFAERLFVNGEAIGKYIRYGFMPDYQNLQIVGIADDAQLFDLRETAPPVIYFSYLQESQPFPEGILYVRAEGNPEALAKTIGREIEALGREYPIRAATLDQMVSRVLVNERVIAVIRQNFIRVENNELNRESSHKGTRSLADTAMLAHGFSLAWGLICLTSIYIHT